MDRRDGSRRGNLADTRTVLQVDPTECGAACLSMILQYHGQYVSLEQLRMETDVSRDGCSAGNIVRAARRRGMKCEGFRKDASQLEQLDPPCILWWEHNHFVVYEGMRGGACHINDPAYGKRTLPMQTLADSFAGIVLTFSPAPAFRDFPEYGKKPKTYLRSRRIREMFRAHGGRAAAAVLAGILSLTAALAALSQSPSGSLLLPVICMLCCIVFAVISECQLRRLKDAFELRGSWGFLHRLFDMPVAFLEQRSPEDLVERIRRNDRADRFTAVDLLRGAVSAAGILLCMVAPLLLIPRCPEAALLILPQACLVLLIFLNQAFWDHRMERHQAGAAVSDARLASALLSGAGRIETIRSLRMDRDYADRTSSLQERSAAAHRHVTDGEIARGAIRYGLCGLFLLAFLLLLSSISRTYADTGIMIWLALPVILIPAAGSLSGVLSRMRQINSEIRGIDDITARELTEEELSDDLPAAEQFRKLQGNIRCRNTSFRYGAFGETILDGLNLYLPVGSSLAVTGPSGSGKSTVGRLLGALLEPAEGAILYDGRTAGEIPDRVICASLAMVKQKSELFAGSIRDNITMWNLNITAEDLTRAIADARAEDCILSREAGLDTLLGERGRGLSGGEQQRIEIARALATNPSILILDEAFTAIDDATTEQIMANIRRRGCTCIVITHDIPLIRGCSQVLDLREKGGAV